MDAELREDIGKIKANVQVNTKEIKQLRDDVRELRREHDKSKGFWGGILFAVSALSAFMVLIIKKLFY